MFSKLSQCVCNFITCREQSHKETNIKLRLAEIGNTNHAESVAMCVSLENEAWLPGKASLSDAASVQMKTVVKCSEYTVAKLSSCGCLEVWE